MGNYQPEFLLTNLSAAQPDKNGVLHFTNTGLLLFTDEPKKFLAESSITAVCYRDKDRFSVVDRIDITGDLISQIEEAVSFVRRHTSVEYEISTQAKRVERYDYPLVAIREAIINALIHRDYAYQNSCTYLNLFSDRLEIENPGGLLPPLTITNLESHSVRRNPLLADLLYRAGYGEKLGSGLLRISQTLQANGNPPYVISATNFFSIQFMPRAKSVGKTEQPRNPQQLEIIVLLEQAGRELSAKQIADQLKVSSTTVTRRLKLLLAEGLVRRIGVGKGMRYTV